MSRRAVSLLLLLLPLLLGGWGLWPAIAGAEEVLPEAVPGVPQTDSIGELQGLVIKDIEVQVMANRLRRNLREVIPIREGQRLSTAAVSRSIELLYRQGNLADVLAEVERLDGGVRLRFKVWPAILVRKVRFSGNRELLDRALNAQLTLREGSIYSFAEAKAQARLLERFYEVEGFRRARVVPEALNARGGQKDVTFKIKEGEQTVIRELTFKGNEFFPPRLLQQSAGLEEGRPFRTELVEESRQALQRFYRAERHLEARIRPVILFDDEDRQVSIRYEIEEGPRVELAFYRTRPPNSGPLAGKVWQDLYRYLPFAYKDGTARKVGWLARLDLLKILDLDAEQQFTDAFSEEAADRITTAKIAEGFDGTKVTTEIVRSEDGREATFKFIIDPGQRVRLEGFSFQGNSFYESQQLDPLFTEAMERFAPRKVYTAEALDQAMVLMTEYYRSQGFLDVRLTPQVKVQETTLRRSAQINILVEEGKRTLVQEVVLPKLATRPRDALTGMVPLVGLVDTPPMTEARLRELVTLQPGEPYNPSKVKAAVEAIQKEYARAGYVYAKVRVTREIPKDSPTNVIVRFELDQGIQARFGEVIVRGSRSTRQEVIRRQLAIAPGDVFNPDQVEKTRQNLSNSGLFQRVSLYPLGGERVRDMMVEVAERKPVMAALSLGLQFSTFALDVNDARVDSTFELTHYNVGGRGHRASLRFELASSYPPTLPDRGGLPIFPDYLLAVGLDLLSYLDKASARRLVLTYQAPYLWGLKLNTTLTGTFFERDRQASWLLNRNSLAVATSKALTPRTNLYLQAQGTLRRPELEETDPSLVLWDVDKEVRLYAQGSAVLLYDRRDNTSRPSNGYLLSVQGELGRAFGCGESWSWNSLTPCTSEAFAPAESWIKASASASALWTPIPWVRLEARLQGGYIIPIGQEDGAVAFEKRFYLGGASTVRGFAQDWLGPHRFREKLLPSALMGTETAVPTGGNAMVWYSTELLIPLERFWGALEDLELAFFRDSGNVFWVGESRSTFEDGVAADEAASGEDADLSIQCSELTSPTGLRSALGVGLRYRTSIGPMRFDVGFPQGKLCDPIEPPFVMHISIGLF